MADVEATLVLRVTPRSAKTRIGPWADGVLAVSVTAPPADGAATAAAMRAVARHVGCPPTTVRLVAGARSRVKRIAIAGITPAELRARLTSGPADAG